MFSLPPPLSFSSRLVRLPVSFVSRLFQNKEKEIVRRGMECARMRTQITANVAYIITLRTCVLRCKEHYYARLSLSH